MSNSSASLKLVLSYGPPGGGTASPPQLSVVAPYKAQSIGIIDVPDGESTATEHDVPFGAVEDEATLVIVKNKTGQDLIVKLNGSLALQHLAPNGVLVHAAPAAAGGSPLTALSLTSTAEQDGDGSIEYFVFGDPAAEV